MTAIILPAKLLQNYPQMTSIYCRLEISLPRNNHKITDPKMTSNNYYHPSKHKIATKKLQFKTLAISYFTHYYDSAHHEPLTYLKLNLLLQFKKICFPSVILWYGHRS